MVMSQTTQNNTANQEYNVGSDVEFDPKSGNDSDSEFNSESSNKV
jgi:hypothetical protein